MHLEDGTTFVVLFPTCPSHLDLQELVEKYFLFVVLRKCCQLHFVRKHLTCYVTFSIHISVPAGRNEIRYKIIASIKVLINAITLSALSIITQIVSLPNVCNHMSSLNLPEW